jgi:ABC-type cobalamin/Fe3+-siderophores transport system ATPase subunit
MKDGLIAGDGSPEEMISTEKISELFGITASVVKERQPHIHMDSRIHEKE